MSYAVLYWQALPVGVVALEMGRETKRPNARDTAVAPLMMRFVSLKARVTCLEERALGLGALVLIGKRGVKDRWCRAGPDIKLAEHAMMALLNL